MHARGWARGDSIYFGPRVPLAGALGILAFTATAAAEPKPTPVDLKPFRAELLVLQDASGGTYVVRPTDEYKVFYGTGKVLYEQVTVGRSKDGTSWNISTWAPRIAELRPASIAFRKDGTYFKSCDGKDDHVLAVIGGDKANAILDNYKFMTPAMTRRPHLLARDDSGVYYYVDVLRKQYGGKGYRVFVGKKGAMKQRALTDVASDSAGEVFSTKTGDLRLVSSTEAHKPVTATWIRGERRTQLVSLDLDVNSPLIFRELGVYKFTGTLCDNI